MAPKIPVAKSVSSDEPKRQGGTVGEMFDAVNKDDVPTLAAIVSRGAPIDLAGHYDETPLLVAVTGEKRMCFDWLVAHGANPNTQDYIGRTPMSFAARKENDEYWLKSLLKHGGNPNVLNTKFQSEIDVFEYPDSTPLFDAIVGGNPRNVKLLVDAGADIDRRANGALSPLALAAAKCHFDIVKLLLQSGADFNVPSINSHVGETLADFLRSVDLDFVDQDQHEPYREVLEFLRSKGVDIEANVERNDSGNQNDR